LDQGQESHKMLRVGMLQWNPFIANLNLTCCQVAI
jgi:hypothetical protein